MTPEAVTHQILVVDDSTITTTAVKHTLETAGYIVWSANSGKEALQLMRRKGMPHLALIDLSMPVMDGIALCKHIHKFSDLPIIILTSIDDEKTVVELLNRYAEDYINKPFRNAELVARVGRVLRRIGDFAYAMEARIVVDDSIELDLPNRAMYVNGTKKSLTPTEARILYILIKNIGNTVRTQHLLERIWPKTEAYEDRLHAHVYRLRKKIEGDPKRPKYIQSDWGIGYFFAKADA